MSKQFQVSANGTTFGTYAADSEQGARDLCAIDAGYKSEADMEAQLGQRSELVATMINDNIQLRGHCQVCGRIQAVRSGHMAHHGYRVENGWFTGKCYGHQHQPMERDITVTQSVIDSVQKQIIVLAAKLMSLKLGEWHPATVQGHWNSKLRDYDRIAWADAPAYRQRHEIDLASHKLDMQIRGGESFIKTMTELIERVHGQPLTEVKRTEKPEQILVGETRISGAGGKLVALKIDGSRVTARNPSGMPIRMSSRAWRALTKAA